ncbi:MAG: UDP-N-acetylglucosamine 2-epimerase (non-hydrolyzing) [candidate division Zixibacteria bacterium]|nr:UDP-N-acetylglucosamine 2-epimerase (non-hydrolyzing) [candidate division Zixibacteria bacterium]
MLLRNITPSKVVKVICVVGARPQFIKLAPLFPLLEQRFESMIIHTGQHYDDPMSAVFFRDLSIPEPDYNLGIGSGKHGAQTGTMMKGLEEVFEFEKPDIVVIFGDTNTTLAGALTAAKMKIKLAHVEAGLRSFVKTMPEEINRVVADRLSDIRFCPTETAVKNLQDEGITDGVHLVGDLMYEALDMYDEIIERKSRILDELSLEERDYILLTIHRAENTDDHKRLTDLIGEILSLSRKVVFPVHPRTRKELKAAGIWEKLCRNDNIILSEPLSYIDNIKLIKNARGVLTDSGGIQKEAYYFGIPTITLRNETEWPETVESGINLIYAGEISLNDIGNQTTNKRDQRTSTKDIADSISNIIGTCI